MRRRSEEGREGTQPDNTFGGSIRHVWEIDIRRYIVEWDRVEEGRDGYTPRVYSHIKAPTYHVGPGIDGVEEVVVRPLLPGRKPAEDVLFDLGLQLARGKR